MSVLVGIAEAFLGYVGVDLGRGEAAVSEEFLDRAEVGASVEEVGGEAVAEGVWTGSQVEADGFEVLDEQASDTSNRESSSEAVEEHGGFARLPGGTEADPAPKTFVGHGTDGTKAFASSLASHANQLLFMVEVVEIEPDQFADAEASAIEGLEHRTIADAEWRIEGDGVEESDHVLDPKQPGEALRLLRVSESTRRVGGDVSLPALKSIEGAEACQPARDGAGCVTPTSQPGRVAAESLRVGIGRIGLVGFDAEQLAEKRAELGQIVLIGTERVGGSIPLGPEVVQKRRHGRVHAENSVNRKRIRAGERVPRRP